MSSDKKKWNKTKTQKTWKKKITPMKVTSVKMEYLIRDKKVGEEWVNFCKWLNFSQNFFFPTSIFPLFFFLPDKEFIPIFFQFFSPYLQNLLLPCFFDVLYLSWLSRAVLTKILKCVWKQGIEKNNNNDINTTRNCTFVNFKNYTTLKIRKRIGFKLVLIISRNKEQVFNTFKDLVWFFNCLCYLRWFKAIQNQITVPLQVLLHLIDTFCILWFDFW